MASSDHTNTALPPGAARSEDECLDAPAFHRNKDAIASVLIDAGADRPCDLLEIACGTGQHASYIARMWPDVTWWPSDIEPDNLKSADAWAARSRVGNVRPARHLDVTGQAWVSGAPSDDLPDAFDIIYAANMVHIAPWQATEGLFTGASRRLRPGGAIILYGPYMRSGQHTADSNRSFDESLRARNPDWGVRDLGDVEAEAARCGLVLREDIAMPANNCCLVFRPLVS